MPDIFSYDSIAALRLTGCPLCRALAEDERRWMTSFWREGRQDAEARRSFYAAGGFCRRHAWLLHALSAEEGTGAVIADLYTRLAERDLAELEQIRRKPRRSLHPRRRCPACVAQEEAIERKAHFFVEALGEPQIADAYRRSDGLCLAHLTVATERALSAGQRETASLLFEDWSRRLDQLRSDLAEYDRKRDYRYVTEPKGREQRAWTDAIRRYVGEDVD